MGFTATKVGSISTTTYDAYDSNHYSSSARYYVSLSGITGVTLTWGEDVSCQVTKLEILIGGSLYQTIDCLGGNFIWGAVFCNYVHFDKSSVSAGRHSITFDVTTINEDVQYYGGNPYGRSNAKPTQDVRFSSSGAKSVQVKVYYATGGDGSHNSNVSYSSTQTIYIDTIWVHDPELYSISNPTGYTSSFYKNETFDKGGLSVSANYRLYTSKNHLYSVSVSSPFSITLPIMTSTGTKTVTVYYSGFSTTYTITVYGVSSWGEPTYNAKYAYKDAQPTIGSATVTYGDGTTSSETVTVSGWNSDSISNSVTISYSYTASKTGDTHNYTSKVEIMEYEPEYEGQVATVVLDSAKHQFYPNETLVFGDDAVLKVYDGNGTLIHTTSHADLSKRIFDADAKYGQTAINYLQDGALGLTFRAYGKTVTHNVCFVYDTGDLIVTDPTTRKYIYYPSDPLTDFDYTGLEVKIYRQVNTYNANGTVTTTTQTRDITSDNNLSHTIDPAIANKKQSHTVYFSYENEYGQTGFTGQTRLPIEVVPYGATDLIVNATGNKTYYKDIHNLSQTRQNGYNAFVKPTGTFQIKYSDDTYSEATALSSNNIWFSRDADDTDETATALVVGTSVITNGDAVNRKNEILAHYQNGDVHLTCPVEITFVNDEIASVALDNDIYPFLGNQLYKIKSNSTIVATFDSGSTATITNYEFINTSIIKTAPQSNLMVQIAGYEKQNGYELLYSSGQDSLVHWQIPYAKIEANYDNFKKVYTNMADKIYPERVGVTMRYYTNATFTNVCDYYNTLTYTQTRNDGNLTNNQYYAYGKGKLSAFTNTYLFETNTLDGTAGTGNISMTDGGGNYVSEISGIVVLRAKNEFDGSFVEEETTVRIIDILEITGIKLTQVKDTYNVGESFLDENDYTKVRIFYKDRSAGDNSQYQSIETELSNDLIALNVYPLKGTKFNQITNDRTVTVTSATNENIRISYNIKVKANYVYGDTSSHSLVALYLNNYVCPDEVTRSKYFLVEEMSNIGIPATREVSGERVINEGVDITNITVLGYLEDINDENKNARVILFYDYIAPIEGSNNIEIKFPCYVEGNADLINKCHFGIMFGNNNSKNRLFLSGNPDHINKDWHSGEVNFEHTRDETMVKENYGYFEDLSECIYGETDNEVIGYDIVSNDKLLVLKSHSDKETTVYFRQPQLVTAINGSGTAVTGLDDETLYQEEFSLSQGNNSVAGISPKAILNFNGDSLFLSYDKQLAGLDLTGIIGDNQRYANSRSYYIDEDLKKQDLDGAFLWSNNKYLFVVLKEKVYVTHFETKHDDQYEWFVIDVKNVSSIYETEEGIFFGTNEGGFYEFASVYHDADKIFAGYSSASAMLPVDDQYELITATSYLDGIDEDGEYYFKPILTNGTHQPYLFFELGTIKGTSDDTIPNCDFYVDNNDDRHVLQLVCKNNGVVDNVRKNLIIERIQEGVPVYFDRFDSPDFLIGIVSGRTNTTLSDSEGVRFYLKEYLGENAEDYLLQVVDKDGNVVSVEDLTSARLCLMVTEPTRMIDIDKEEGKFALSSDGEKLNIIRYGEQLYNPQFKVRGEIIKNTNVEAYYISKPYTMGNLEYFKTIWSFTLTNDSNVPSELDVCVANNKIPYEKLKTLASISKEQFGLDFNSFSFTKVDFDKDVVPRTYTHKRILSGIKFACFGFKNYNDTNSVLSSMTITYTLPYPSYGGD